ncbi:MAG: hypothetical protein H6907_12360 [Hyphomicrobiales bacterium]|nr:hypothetical protein [Hyphomicrobiales bacterium]MCP5372515.1 hypothetical protein [Hyphomicrobiales bacterium]
MQPGDKTTASRMQRELNQQRTPIQATRDKAHPRWKEAAHRYNDLQNAIVAKANQPAPAAAPASAGAAPAPAGGAQPATAQPAAAPSDPKVAEALAKVVDYEGKLKSLAPGDKQTAQTYLDDLKGVVPLLQGAQDKSHPSWKDTLARYNAVNDGINARANQSPDAIPTDGLRSHEVVKVKRMARKVLSAEATIQKAPGAEFRDPARAKEMEDVLAGVDMEILNFSQPDHPSMAAMTRLVQRARGVLKDKVAQVQNEVAALGNLDANLDAIRGRMKSGGNPPAIDENTTPEQAVALVKEAIARDGQYAKDLAYLDKVKQSGYGPRDTTSMIHWIGDRRQKNLESVVGSRDRLATQIDADMQTVQFYTNLDPLNAHQRSNNFLMEGRSDEILANYDKFQNRIAVLDAILTTLNDQKRLAETAKAKDAIVASREKYKKNYIVALGAVRMPQAAKHDDEMVEAAKAVLSNPKYEGVHKILRMVINTPKRRQEIMETSIRGTVTGASATSNMKVWDEFQVTTAEELPSGEVYKFFTTIKYFHKGGTTTPTGRWLMSGRFKGERILKENVDK